VARKTKIIQESIGTRTSRRRISKCQESLLAHKNLLLSSRVLSIDPSSASSSSKPGWALWDRGILVEMGVLDIKSTLPLSTKLQMIRHLLQTEFPGIAAVLLEGISAVPVYTKKQVAGIRHAGGQANFMTTIALQTLNKAVGVFIASWPIGTPVIEVPVMTWKSRVRKILGVTTLEKSDDTDAMYIGLAVFDILKGKDK
jgi:hypothetical protein